MMNQMKNKKKNNSMLCLMKPSMSQKLPIITKKKNKKICMEI